MIARLLKKIITVYLHQRKVIMLFGARQVGKTTLLKRILDDSNEKILYLSADEADIRENLSNATTTKLRLIIKDNTIIVIDEAQKIPGIGTTLKLFADNIPEVQVIATGSSAFELANKSNESLTGRKYEFFLFPLSFKEMVDHHGYIEESRLLEHRLIFGYYPEIVCNLGKEEKLIKLITNSYLYKDILQLEQIKRPILIEKILKALALQVGSEVTYNELAQTVKSDPQTVEKYIEILEKAFIVFKLPALNRNVRNEIKKGKKIYFYDTGIRNAIIGNFTESNKRTDIGALWENYVISERIKKNIYEDRNVSSYFWRTTQQQEIDYIEEINGEYLTFEFKWNSNKKGKLSTTFSNAYKVLEHKNISPSNIEEFLL